MVPSPGTASSDPAYQVSPAYAAPVAFRTEASSDVWVFRRLRRQCLKSAHFLVSGRSWAILTTTLKQKKTTSRILMATWYDAPVGNRQPASSECAPSQGCPVFIMHHGRRSSRVTTMLFPSLICKASFNSSPYSVVLILALHLPGLANRSYILIYILVPIMVFYFDSYSSNTCEGVGLEPHSGLDLT